MLYRTMIILSATLPLFACMDDNRTRITSTPQSSSNTLGASLDEKAQKTANTAWNEALEHGKSGQITAWVDSDRRFNGEIVPKPVTYEGTTPCREYSHTLKISGKSEVTSGKACRNPNGSWRKV